MHRALQEKPPNQDKEEAKRTWWTGKPTMSALDEKVDCAWLQSGLTGHRGTDKIRDKGGRPETVQNLMMGAMKPRERSSKTHLSQFSLQSVEKKKMFASGLVNQ